jgi:hypothetical protein
MQTYMGRQGMIWWEGVVEDINDPLYLGRIRVRIFGTHTKDKSKIPTDKLPWASPIMPISSASSGGLGQSATGVINGAWVVGYFRDGDNAQDPIVWGTVPGAPTTAADTTQGYNDPDAVYPPAATTPWEGGSEIGEPDTNRLATGQSTGDTIVGTKKSNARGNMLFSEPPSPYAAQYPFNKVLSTISGHQQEFDDTPGAERIHTYHRSGTFEEYHPNGDHVRKIMGDSYEIIMGNKQVEVVGDVNLLVGGNVTIKSVGTVDIHAGGSILQTGSGGVSLWGGDINLNSGSSPSTAASVGAAQKAAEIQAKTGWDSPLNISDGDADEIAKGTTEEIENNEAVEYGDGGIANSHRSNTSPVNGVAGPQNTEVQDGLGSESTFDPVTSELLNFMSHTDPRISGDLKNKAEALARKWGRTLTITSAYRSPAYNAKVGGAKKSVHVQGKAIDVVMNGVSTAQRQAFIQAACDLGFGGIGVYKTFIHIDIAGKRCWGPSGSRKSLPTFKWAQDVLKKNSWPGA